MRFPVFLLNILPKLYLFYWLKTILSAHVNIFAEGVLLIRINILFYKLKVYQVNITKLNF